MKKLLFKSFFSIILIFVLSACGMLPRVSAQQRMFLDLSLEFLGEYQLPKQTFQDTPIGGLSAITYDRQTNRFYAISDDRSQLAPARFYTLNLHLNRSETGKVNIDKIEIEGVTFLKNERGETYPPGTIDLEGIALSPRGTLFISSEGAIGQNIQPFIGEFDLKTGKLQQNLRIPQRFLFADSKASETEPRGIQDNLGFEALTLGQNSVMKDDPFRLFTATESALLQDSPPKTPEENARIRLLHYVINPIGEPVLVSENLYLLDGASNDTLANGLCELTALEREGYLLALERTLGLSGFGAKIYQVVNSNGTDTSRLLSFQGNLAKVVPLQKKLLLDLGELGIDLDNLEGMTLGPKLPDGSQTLVVVSDDNFKNEQVTQFLLFRLTGA
ncbi:endonuclease/exonuclease/phosphatase [Hydrococcus rivularis NIES-593]|uniref:Endonuclease/exonuclease/phosphatase n=1 Tax=Hydrococcus rivularis NIES-593 TaxID=1921803 RepID=A0A1U7HE49_9CYAN|nr:esterase-like activity of phytase family protein [Hydrococcus rivularis]OKH21856.1 endonuclease/exonuclease/phosphatase [Hydrococcus rivularis NIES-593]